MDRTVRKCEKSIRVLLGSILLSSYFVVVIVLFSFCCFVVIDRKEYDEKMKDLLNDEKTYKEEKKQPFKKIERELNARLLTLKNKGKVNERTYIPLMVCHLHQRFSKTLQTGKSFKTYSNKYWLSAVPYVKVSY